MTSNLTRIPGSASNRYTSLLTDSASQYTIPDMSDNWSPRKRATYLRNKFRRLNEKRKKEMANRRKNGGAKRRRLTVRQREEILKKTDGRCHLCGGKVGARWEADHVHAHGHGGQHSVDNYLAAHSLCNNYRWHYLPEELQYIIKLGVWAKKQVETDTSIGEKIAAGFVQQERTRLKRVARKKV